MTVADGGQETDESSDPTEPIGAAAADTSQVEAEPAASDAPTAGMTARAAAGRSVDPPIRTVSAASRPATNRADVMDG